MQFLCPEGVLDARGEVAGSAGELAQRAAAIIARAIEKEAGIASLLKANQIGTITDTDTLEAIRVSSKAERHVGSGSGWPGLLGEMALQVEMPELVHRSGLP